MSDPTANPREAPPDLGDLVGCLHGIYLTPASDSQMPLLSLRVVGGNKRYARVWLDSPTKLEWGWSLPDSSICIWDKLK